VLADVGLQLGAVGGSWVELEGGDEFGHGDISGLSAAQWRLDREKNTGQAPRLYRLTESGTNVPRINRQTPWPEL
jgi:hypothetical protein